MSTYVRDVIIGIAAVVGVVIVAALITGAVFATKNDIRDKEHELRMEMVESCSTIAAYDDAQAECVEELSESLNND